MAVFVLVPGFWLGARSWQDVARPLRAEGHEVYPLSLTGMGERRHLAGPDTDLDTHVQDIVELIDYEDLRDVVLVAHSGACGPVTVAADRIPERLSTVVYLESGPLPDGMSQLDTYRPEVQDFVAQRIAEQGDGWRYPMPSWEEQQWIGASIDGLDAAERALFLAQVAPQPSKTFSTPLCLRNPARDELAKVLITCSFPLDEVRKMIEAGHPFFAALAGPHWRFRELRTGHWPMFSRPADTASVLHELTVG